MVYGLVKKLPICCGILRLRVPFKSNKFEFINPLPGTCNRVYRTLEKYFNQHCSSARCQAAWLM